MKDLVLVKQFFLLIFCVGSISAVKCYQCSSAATSGCGEDDFKKDNAETSDDVCTYCQVAGVVVIPPVR